MFKRKLNKILLVLTGLLLVVCGGYAQTDPTTPMDDYTDLGSINATINSDDPVCPSLDENSDGNLEESSTSVFRLPVYNPATPEIGLPEDNSFEWVVFGGWITEINYSTINEASYSYSRLRTTTGNIRYSYLTAEGVSNPGDPQVDWEVFITVEWDTTNFSTQNGWVAVRHLSEWSCTDGGWSVFENIIVNNPPQFVDATFPADLTLPYQLRNNYSLPLPEVTDEGCNRAPFFTYTVTLPDATEISGDETDTEVDLQVGDNLVTWTADDGSKTVSRSYIITVEPSLDILHVAWLNPTCNGSDDGSLLVTNNTDYSFVNSIEYSLNSDVDADYIADDHFEDLNAGTYTIRGRMVYNIDADNDGTDEQYVQQANDSYTATLVSNAATAVDDVPPEGTNVDVNDAGCLTDNDGSIEVTEGVMQPQNHSVEFDGDDYLVTNKSYSSSLSQFSVATWVKIPSSGDVGGTIISFDNEEFYELSVIYYSTTDRALIRFYTNPEDGVFRHTTIVNDNEWHLVVATYDNGNRAIYIDGVKLEDNSAAPQSVGQDGVSRYGIIGARSKTDVFADTPSSPFFKGQMAEIGIWDNYVLTDTDVTNIMKNGMVGTSDHWSLNNTPAEISAAYDHVFTDLGNSSIADNWARFYNGVRIDTDSPLLLSWTDDLGGTIDDDYLPVYTLEDIGIGNYTLHVKDVLGCGEDTETYNVENSDALPPELYWNVAINKEADQLTTNGSNFASLAVDGLGAVSPLASASQTSNDSEVWWEVDLGNLFSVREILIHPASDFADFYVMTSPNAFSTASDLSEDLARGDVNSYEHVGSTNGETRVRIPGSARFVRIRTSGNASLHLAEVEVFASVASPVREIYLRSGVCYYEILDDEFGIVPMVYDACDGITNFENDRTSTDNLIGEQLTHNPVSPDNWTDYTVTWTADDDAGLSSNPPLSVTYRVIDNELPVMNPLPFGNASQTITYCESQSYSLLLPKITDNYPLSCDNLNYIELYSDNLLAYEKLPISDYNPSIDQYTGNLDYEDFLSPGDHDIIWKVEDYSGNFTSDTLFLHVEVKPQVVEVKTSPITCSGDNNANVIFSDITSEQDVNPAVDVDYVLENTLTSDVIRQTNNSEFQNNVPVGSYNAYIEVNGCRSADYYNIIEIVDPDPITLTPEITPVECSGWNDGSIELLTSGGSETDVLHFWGEDNTGASAGNYDAIDLTGVGSVEAWVYIDTLGGAVGETNYNTGLFGAENCYGFTIENGQLVFFAGTEEAGPVAIAAEQWVHLAGTWSAADQAMKLYIGGIQQATTTIDAAFVAPVDGDLFMGYLPGGGADNGLQGFVRNMRVWNKLLTPADISSNFYLLDPIDAGANLAANFPVAAGGGTDLQNRVALPGATAGTVNTSDYTWQKFAYRWENSSGDFVARSRDIFNQVADEYTVQMQDPLGCVHSEPITININDTDKPVLTFFSDGQGNTELTVGEPIVRYTDDTNSDARNISGDCMYYPVDAEFDPKVFDGACPVNDVTLSFQVLTGDYAPADPPAVDASSLDGVSMTDVIRLRWTAEDQNNNTRTAEVSYYIIDNEGPVLTWENQVRNTDLEDCFYTVTEDDSLLGLSYFDNCETGRLYNNINGTQSLEGESFAPGDHTIRWIYADKTFPGGYFVAQAETITHTLTVVDNQPPSLVCNAPFSVELDANGDYTLSNLDVVASWGDNCSEATAVLHVTKNVAYSAGTATMLTYYNGTCYTDDADNANAALDGNTSSVASDCSSALTTAEADPYWEVDLGAAHTLYGVNLFESDAAALGNFWVLVSDDGTFENTGNWTEAGASFGADVVYAEYFSATVTGNELFTFPAAVQNATHVQIRMNTASAQLALAEVEIYGTTDAVNATELELSCDDVRYTPAPDTGESGVWDDAKGDFNPIGILLTAIDTEGNITSCLADVEVQDNTQPNVIPVNADIALDTEGNIDLNDYVNDIDDGSSDACGIETLWITPREAQTCVSIGNFDVRLYVRDVNGNVDWRAATVNIIDDIPPQVILNSNIQLQLDPDGIYEVQPYDIFADVEDNCTSDDDLIYTFTPSIVECTDLTNNGYIDFIVEVTDANGQETTINFTADDPDLTARVQVVDLLPPEASLENFVLTIPEDGDSMIRFQDIIPNSNLFDNCDGYGENIPVKLISYDEGTSWCMAGSEGSGGDSQFSSWESYVDNYGASSSPYTGTILSNLNDGNYNNTLNDVYISNDNSGPRTVYYYFDDTYQFNGSSIRWHEDILSPESQVPRSNITISNNNNANPLSGYPISRINDGATNQDYYCNNDNLNDRKEIYYSFGSNSYSVSRVVINWEENSDLAGNWWTYDTGDARDPDNAWLYYTTDGGTTWIQYTGIGNVEDGGSIDLPSTSSPINGLRLSFDTDWRDRWFGDDYYYRAGISEWSVYYTDATQNCSLPSTNTLSWWDGSNWQPLGSYTATVPANENEISFGTVVPTNAFKLEMTTSFDRRVGIREWSFNGRNIPTGNPACSKYYCSDIENTPVPVWLQWEDESGNSDGVQVDITVEPYFNINEIQIKDCGYDGERYYPILSGLSPSQNYYYTWDQINDVANNGDRQNLFEYSDGTSSHDDKVPLPVFDADAYEMPVVNQSWINLSTGNTSRFPDTADDGNYYEISLNMQDDNGCYDDYDYQFEYDGGATEAVSIKPWEACVGDTVRFEVLFPESFTFWREDYMQYAWVGIDESLVEVIGGGNSQSSTLRGIDDECNTWFGPTTQYVPQVGQNGDHFIEVVFKESTAANGGATTNIRYEFVGSQYTGATPDQVYVGTGSYVSGDTYLILGELSPGGPYLIENEPTNGRTIPVGQQYIYGSCTFFNDYGACKEILEYQTTVYNVVPPEIQAYDAYNSETWIPAGNLQVCPRDTIWYRVNNVDAGDYEFFEWNNFYVDEGDTIYTGRRLAQGNWYDDSIQIVWDEYPIEPELTVYGFNVLDCESEPTVISHQFTDNEGPVLQGGDCSVLDLTHDNNPGQCTYTFQNIEPPSMTDNCRNRIADFWCEVDTDGDSTPDITGKNAAGTYPVGETTVHWYAEDYSGNDSTCSFTVTVEDTEAPTFNKIPTDTIVYSNNGCDHVFTGTKRDVTADDNCDDNTITLTADIFHYNETTSVYDLIESDLLTLDGVTFLKGTNHIVWTVHDGVDNDGDTFFENEAIVDFYITVTDDTPPVIDPLAAISEPNDAGVCSATLTIDPPGTDVISDNCSADGNLSVEFVSRDDGADVDDSYPVGTTTITWSVTDEANISTTATQTVTVNDTQEPWLDDAEFALQDTSIGYCKRSTHQLPIPTPYDNCEVESITWEIVNNGGTAYNATGTITRSESPNFNPNGDGLTDIIPPLPADNETGSDYTVTWSITDAATPANTNSTVYSYTIHVEIEPYFNKLDAIPMSCGNANDGQIAVITSEEYRVEPGYDVYYTIDNWENEQTSPIFTGLSGGTYNVEMRVNGCFSGTRQATIIQPEVYDMTLAETNPYCYEAEDGEIDLTMTGGVDGQVLFTGGAGLTAGHYTELDLTSTGSIEGWVYLESYDDAMLIAKGTDYSLQLLGSKFTIDVNGTHLGDGATEGAGITPELQRWYYVAASWDTGAGEMQLFVSGANQGGSVQGTLSDAPANSSDVSIGNSFDGIIRETRIWDNVVDGTVPSSKYTGSEDHLVAFWPMDDGSGNAAENSCNNKNSNATNASGATGLWATNQPQPGTYTWTKDGAFYSNNIDLTDLGRGVYEVSFQDPYSCPAAQGLVRSVTIIPSDNEQPNISTTVNTTLFIDPGDDCQHLVTAQDFTDNPGLLPTVTDACDFTLSWRVIPTATLIPQSFVGTNYEGAVLELGNNRVEVTASQYNGNVTATSFFNITVEDDIPPVADGKNVTDVELSNDYEPMGSGIVYYSAIGFNQESDDNCTPKGNLEFSIRRSATDPWSDEILFDRDDVGEEVRIFFRVKDEAGLTAEESGNTTMTVVDIHDPVFLNDGTIYEYEECATVDAGESTGEPAYMVVSAGNLKLNEGLYSDNCGITNIQYSLDHEGDSWGDIGWTDGDDPSADGVKFYEGVTHVYFKLTDTSTHEAETQIYKVTTLPKPEPGGGIY
ncbi:MAG: HYR domain-containing protein [Prolixibacteraceae bacterium]|jgi:hypothetical protein|nr:HYR domain-containing protein [Prolixibacteraceae bacterium]